MTCERCGQYESDEHTAVCEKCGVEACMDCWAGEGLCIDCWDDGRDDDWELHLPVTDDDWERIYE